MIKCGRRNHEVFVLSHFLREKPSNDISNDNFYNTFTDENISFSFAVFHKISEKQFVNETITLNHHFLGFKKEKFVYFHQYVMSNAYSNTLRIRTALSVLCAKIFLRLIRNLANILITNYELKEFVFSLVIFGNKKIEQVINSYSNYFLVISVND